MDDKNAVMETGTHKGRVSEIGCESRRESRKIEYPKMIEPGRWLSKKME
jgi:hypothetical protein